MRRRKEHKLSESRNTSRSIPTPITTVSRRFPDLSLDDFPTDKPKAKNNSLKRRDTPSPNLTRINVLYVLEPSEEGRAKGLKKTIVARRHDEKTGKDSVVFIRDNDLERIQEKLKLEEQLKTYSGRFTHKVKQILQSVTGYSKYNPRGAWEHTLWILGLITNIGFAACAGYQIYSSFISQAILVGASAAVIQGLGIGIGLVIGYGIGRVIYKKTNSKALAILVGLAAAAAISVGIIFGAALLGPLFPVVAAVVAAALTVVLNYKIGLAIPSFFFAAFGKSKFHGLVHYGDSVKLGEHELQNFEGDLNIWQEEEMQGKWKLVIAIGIALIVGLLFAFITPISGPISIFFAFSMCIGMLALISLSAKNLLKSELWEGTKNFVKEGYERGKVIGTLRLVITATMIGLAFVGLAATLYLGYAGIAEKVGTLGALILTGIAFLGEAIFVIRTVTQLIQLLMPGKPKETPGEATEDAATPQNDNTASVTAIRIGVFFNAINNAMLALKGLAEAGINTIYAQGAALSGAWLNSFAAGAMDVVESKSFTKDPEHASTVSVLSQLKIFEDERTTPTSEDSRKPSTDTEEDALIATHKNIKMGYKTIIKIKRNSRESIDTLVNYTKKSANKENKIREVKLEVKNSDYTVYEFAN